uniref:Pre-mRNA-splicing factor Syf1/CRNKL1-like C-terminal HAT-repeats domain-containing protein n=1 Tax=Tetranychus urticae TaxID=32264 RepID=T1L1F4_TETUR
MLSINETKFSCEVSSQIFNIAASHSEFFRGSKISLFKWLIVYDLWNTYLTKFLQRYKGSKLERARDLLEQCLEVLNKGKMSGKILRLACKISLFKWPIVYDLWNTYLTKFLQRYKGSKLDASTRFTRAMFRTLSVTIAIGCSLLILNVLIFAGFFYTRDLIKSKKSSNSNNDKAKQVTEAELSKGSVRGVSIISGRDYMHSIEHKKLGIGLTSPV